MGDLLLAGQALQAQRVVDGTAEAQQRIADRAVEIEDDDAGGHVVQRAACVRR